MKRIYWQVAPVFYYWTINRRITHEAPLDPLKLRWVDPTEITRFTGRRGAIHDRWQDVGEVEGGDWDLRDPTQFEKGRPEYVRQLFLGETIEETVMYKSFKQRFKCGVNWDRTELIRELAAILEERGEVWHGCGTMNDLRRRCEEIDELYNQISQSGYQTQFELVSKNGCNRNQIGYLDLLTDEITVDIGRDGELLLVDGKHRLSIAKLLELDEVPITVLVRHQQWLGQREHLWAARSDINHPDVPRQHVKKESNNPRG